MNIDQSCSAVSRFSAPGTIAWLSLFLLTFAVGGIAEQQWHKFALQAGAVGLISAVGLGSLEKARRAREKVRRDSALRERLDRQIGLEEWEIVNGSQMRVTTSAAQSHFVDGLLETCQKTAIIPAEAIAGRPG